MDFAESSGSHFRFKDEQDVEEPGEGGSVQSSFTLNCDELTDYILCTPLHERLDISTSHFEVRSR